MGEVGWDRVLTLMNPGETFREARRIFHRTLEGKRVDKVYQFTTGIECR
jgi:hypothetical protein